MRQTSGLWKEIDDAVLGGFVAHMEEISKDSPSSYCRVYGTRIWFSTRVAPETYEKVVDHIRKNYQVKVEQPLPFCIVIWEN